MSPWLVFLALVSTADARRNRATPDPDLDAVAAELMGRALASSDAYDELRSLCDDIGHRLSGSPQLEQAIDWAAEEMRSDGLSVTLEPVKVPHWVRGEASLSLVAPRKTELSVLALGGSVATPTEGLVAPVLVVSDFDELQARKDEVPGRIVVYDAPFTSYGDTVRYRWDGASQASRLGAVASLVRSVTDHSLHTLHVGGMGYADDVTPIPHGAITVETATMLHRLQEAGETPELALFLSPTFLPEADSFNVVGEITGRSAPEEVVVLGCHLDSWDVGQGAQDDGSGCTNVMAAGALLKALPVPPRRTVRVVLYTNEENGLGGGRAYAEAHAGERIVAAVEDDTGAGAPTGFRVDVRRDGERSDEAAQPVMDALLPHLAPLGPLGSASLTPSYGGADIGPLVEQGTVGFGLGHDMSEYWWIHHTRADTFEKVDPGKVRKNVATMTVLAWILAEHPTAVDTLAGRTP